jgi:hypothetical protein
MHLRLIDLHSITAVLMRDGFATFMSPFQGQWFHVCPATRRRRVGGVIETSYSFSGRAHQTKKWQAVNFTSSTPRSYQQPTHQLNRVQPLSLKLPHFLEISLALSYTTSMSAQPDNQPMEGVQDPSVESKGKGKAPEGDHMEESMDDDSSDESGVEDQVCSPPSAYHIKAQTANMIASGR